MNRKKQIFQWWNNWWIILEYASRSFITTVAVKPLLQRLAFKEGIADIFKKDEIEFFLATNMHFLHQGLRQWASTVKAKKLHQKQGEGINSCQATGSSQGNGIAFFAGGVTFNLKLASITIIWQQNDKLLLRKNLTIISVLLQNKLIQALYLQMYLIINYGDQCGCQGKSWLR